MCSNEKTQRHKINCNRDLRKLGTKLTKKRMFLCAFKPILKSNFLVRSFVTYKKNPAHRTGFKSFQLLFYNFGRVSFSFVVFQINDVNASFQLFQIDFLHIAEV